MKRLSLKSIDLFSILGFISVLFLIVFTIGNNNCPYTYDEPWYQSNVDALKAKGLSKEFLIEMKGPAGPTHAIVFYLFRFFTGDNLVLVRLVNVFLLIITLLILQKATKVSQVDSTQKSLALMSIPMTFAAAGLAITNMPAMLFTTMSLYLLLISLKKDSLLLSALGGLMLSFAILARQPYLVVSVSSLILLFDKNINKKNTIVFFITSIILPLYVFSIWQDIAPKWGGNDTKVRFLAPEFLFSALGYSFLVTVLIAPSFLVRLRSKQLLILSVALVSVFGLCYLFNFKVLVLGRYFTLLPEGIQGILKIVNATILVCFGLYFLASLAYRTWENRENKIYTFSSACIFLICLSCIKVTHLFSSLYVLQAAPFLILNISPYMKLNKIELAGRVLGTILGILSLISFFR
jgi:hypothetical protein